MAKQPNFRDSLSLSEAHVLAAYKRCRRNRPEVLPTIGEIAHEAACTSQTASDTVHRLASKGWMVRTHSHRWASRVWCLTHEAAARPHLTALLSIAAFIARMPPECVNDSLRSKYGETYAKARVIMHDVTSCIGQIRDQHDDFERKRKQRLTRRKHTGGQDDDVTPTRDVADATTDDDDDERSEEQRRSEVRATSTEDLDRSSRMRRQNARRPTDRPR